jgi:hypothetical protein
MASSMNKKILLLILSVLFLSACKKQIYQFGLDKNKLKIDEIQFEYFQGRSKIKYLDGTQGINATANIRIKKDSVIWISVTPALGIEALRAMITFDSVYVIDRLNKKYQVISMDSISKHVNFNLTYSMIESLIIGNMIVHQPENDVIVKEGNYYQLKQQKGNLSIDNFVNSKTMKVEKVSVIDDTTRNYMDIDYHNFQMVDSLLFPMDNSISLFYADKNKTLNTQIIITFTKVSFHDKKVRFPFNVPNRYEPREN